MSKDAIAVVFDYTGLPADAKGKLIALEGQLKKARKHAGESLMEIGRIVSEAHELLCVDKSHDSKFREWVETAGRMSEKTARNFLNVFQRFHSSSCVTITHEATNSAVYALAAPSVPDEAIKEAARRIEKGHRLDLEEAKEIIGQYSDKKPSKSMSTKPAENKPGQTENTGNNSEEPRRPSGGATFDPSEWETPASELLDGLKQPVPKEFVSIFRQAEEFDVQRRRLSELKTWLKAMADKDGGFEIKKQLQQLTADANNLSAAIKFAQPHTICPYCHDKPGKVQKCDACHGNGWVTEAVYRAAPKEKKRETAAVSR